MSGPRVHQQPPWTPPSRVELPVLKVSVDVAQLCNLGSDCWGKSCVKDARRRGLLTSSLGCCTMPLVLAWPMLQQCLCLATYCSDPDLHPWTGHPDLISGLLHDRGLAWWALWLIWLPLLDLILTLPCWLDFLAWPQTFLITMGLSGYLNFWLNLSAVSRPTHLIFFWVQWGRYHLLVRALPLPAFFPYLAPALES